MTSRCAPALALALALGGCGQVDGDPRPAPASAGARFSGAAAMTELVALMALPRALGDPRRAASIVALEQRLRARGAATVERFDHEGRDPWGGEALAMTSLIAGFRPAAPRRFILATHFDTRPWAEEDPDPTRRDAPIPGANDGTSGVAVLLELASRLLVDLDPDVGFWVILFDGEELGRPPAEGYCAGSLALAAAIRAGEGPALDGAAFAIVVDMIGDVDLTIAPEGFSLASAPWLVDRLWASAAVDAHAGFVAGPTRTIRDDHVALAELGIPSILVIDGAYPAWHTHGDTVDRIAPASLGAVGEALRVALVDLSRGPWPPGRGRRRRPL